LIFSVFDFLDLIRLVFCLILVFNQTYHGYANFR